MKRATFIIFLPQVWGFIQSKRLYFWQHGFWIPCPPTPSGSSSLRLSSSPPSPGLQFYIQENPVT